MTPIDEEFIEKTRREMIQCGIEYGLENEKTLLLSKKLDVLLNQVGCLRSSTTRKTMINENESVLFKS